MSYGGIYAGEGEGIYAGGPYRTCKKYQSVPSEYYGHKVKRCAPGGYDIHKPREGFNLPTRKKYARRRKAFNLPLDGEGYYGRGSVANKRAAKHNPWLQFLQEWRARTGSNDLHIAAQEYHRRMRR